jgi:hypothetical protein
MQHTDLFVILTLVIMLPIIPAFLLFKALPSRANASGPFHGLEIKLGGAFAGYFVLVILVIAELPRMRSFIEPQTAQVWTVEGHLVDQKGQALELGPCDIQFTPPAAIDQRDNWFKARFTTGMTVEGGMVEFPSVSIAHPGFPNARIPLTPTDVKGSDWHATVDESSHAIKLNAIVFKKPPGEYAPTGAPPKAVDPPPSPNSAQSSSGKTP